MTTLQRLTTDLTASMKAREAFRTNTLRQLIASVRTEEKAGKVARELTDAQVQTVLGAEIKKRRESAGIYAGVGASERAANEAAEADLIESYLPDALTDEQVTELVATAISALGATTLKDMGAVMKHATAAAAQLGRVDGKALSMQVRTALGAGTR